MKERNLKQKDLIGIFKSKGIASEVINGKRSISKAQAKELGLFFNVSPAYSFKNI
jgi:HTH-type transcriptional regulator/antitoxin HigA